MFKRLSVPISVLFFLVSQSGFSQEHIVGFAFDWDDNIFEMPTEIMLFHKKSGVQKGVSTEQFALIRQDIGKAGTAWADYELRSSNKDGSLRFFGDASAELGKAAFSTDVKKAMTTPKYHWQGPVWQDFVSAMKDPATSKHTSIITARLHEPSTVLASLADFKKKGLIKNTPVRENIWTVSNPNFSSIFKQIFLIKAPEGSAADPSLRKAAVMENILDRINRARIPKSAPETLASSGVGFQKNHLWGFSDDDYGNFSKAVSVLQTGVDANRWPHVKITVFFTGTNHAVEKPRAIVLRPKAAPRAFTEKDEWKKILGKNSGILIETQKQVLP
jgi:hypothetical protein